MEFTAKDVMKLREMSGAGMMDSPELSLQRWYFIICAELCQARSMRCLSAKSLSRSTAFIVVLRNNASASTSAFSSAETLIFKYSFIFNSSFL